jgi:capsular polysaccharide transport system permease protein
MKRRHLGVIVSFLIFVLLPAAGSAWYLWTRAVDQYASTVGFSVRTEKASSAIELLGGITNLSGSSTSDTDILYEFIQSQKLVADIDKTLDLRAIWSRPENDPIFAYDASGTIEDLLDYWKRMVQVSYDSGTGLIEVRALAFTAQDATRIAREIFDQSTAMINALSDTAREDAIRYSREELDTAVARLKVARKAMTAFRNRHQIVDPASDIKIQIGLLGTLQAQLAEALIEHDLLTQTTRANDPRITQSTRRIKVIENRIEQERNKLGIGDSTTENGSAFADLVGEYESLAVDREFAERTYTAALTNYDSALAEARRQSRYLAAYVMPTEPQKAEYPQRGVLLALLGLFLFLTWSILVLIYYSLRDRR